MARRIAPPKKSKWLFIAIIAAAAVVLTVSLVNLVKISNEDLDNVNTYESLRSYVSEPGVLEVSGSVERIVDFASLQSVNPDITAWILIPDTKIDYPVTVGRDNEYYISHSADLTENRAGAIFLDQNSSDNFTDRNTVLYGHNMNNGTMFAGLHAYEDADFFASHPYVYIFTAAGEKHQYRVFSVAPVSVAGNDLEPYTISFSNDQAFLDYLQKMQAQSIVPVNLSFTPDDQIITLSTCIKGKDNYRLIVQAVRES